MQDCFICENHKLESRLSKMGAHWGPPLQIDFLERVTFCSEPILISNDWFSFECQQYRLIIIFPTGRLDKTFLWCTVVYINKLFETFSALETLIYILKNNLYIVLNTFMYLRKQFLDIWNSDYHSSCLTSMGESDLFILI